MAPGRHLSAQCPDGRAEADGLELYQRKATKLVGEGSASAGDPGLAPRLAQDLLEALVAAPPEQVLEGEGPAVIEIQRTNQMLNEFIVIGSSVLGFVAACLLCSTLCRRAYPVSYYYNSELGRRPQELLMQSLQTPQGMSGDMSERRIGSYVVPSPPITVPFEPGEWLLSWLTDSLALSVDDVVGSAGLDSGMLVELYHLALALNLLVGLPQLLVLLPLHYFVLGGSNWETDRGVLFGYFSILTVPSDSLYFLVHLGCVWYTVAVAMFLILRAQASFRKRRAKWLEEQPYPWSNTVLVQNIPPTLCSDVQLEMFFKTLFGGKGSDSVVVSAYVVKETAVLRSHFKNALEATKAVQRAEFEKRTTGFEPFVLDYEGGNSSGEIVTAIPHFRRKLMEWLGRIKDERASIGDRILRGEASAHHDAGFVTFRRRRDAVIAASMSFAADDANFRVTAAGSPKDIIWEDLARDTEQELQHAVGSFVAGFLYTRAGTFTRALALIGYVVLLFGSLLIFGEVFSLVTILLLSTRAEIGFVTWVRHSIPIAPTEAPLEAGVVLAVLFTYPDVLQSFSGFFVFGTRTAHQLWIQGWFYTILFTYLLVFLPCLVLVFRNFAAIRASPENLPRIIGQDSPSMSGVVIWFFVWGICTYACEHSRWLTISPYVVRRRFYEDHSARWLSEPESQAYSGIGARNARDTFFLVAMLIVVTIQPLIAAFAFPIFVLARLTYAHLVVFSETRKPDSGGRFWCESLLNIQYGLFFYICFMTLLLLYRASTPWFALGVLLSLAFLIPLHHLYLRRCRWEALPVDELLEDPQSPRKAGPGGQPQTQQEGAYSQKEIDPERWVKLCNMGGSAWFPDAKGAGFPEELGFPSTSPRSGRS